jgi:hypothetical protein
MTQTTPANAELSIHEMPWPEFIDPPPTDLPYDDREPMESPWHATSGPLLKASYVARHGGRMTDYYVGVNMFVYYSWQQVRNGEEHTWLRFYTNEGALVLLPEEAERQRAETERQRADDLATRLAVLEAELRVLRGEETQP